MGNGGSLEGYGDHILLCILDALADSFRNLRCLAETVSDSAVAVADNHKSRKTCDTSALDGLGYAVYHNELLEEITGCGII